MRDDSRRLGRLRAGWAVACLLVSVPAAPARTLDEWEIPIIAQYLVCDGPLEVGCARFLEGDFTAARRVFESHAEGNPGAQNNLGVVYESGRGAEESREKALAWYRKAVSSRVGMAHYNLAMLLAGDYALGTGNPETRANEMAEAYVQLTLADRAGVEWAADSRQRLVEFMTPEEREAGARRVRLLDTENQGGRK